MIKGAEYYEPFLQKLKIEKLNPMQLEMWKSAQTDQDITLRSPTGTGKTLAFLLPLISKIDSANSNIQALIITPTRELAMQIHSVAKSMGTGLHFALCYGGHSLKEESVSLTKNPQVVIGTPGRIHHHIRRGNLDIDTLSVLVFDEWDKSLELGFQEDIKDIVRHPKAVNQFVLTSATNGVEIPGFISLSDPFQIDYLTDREHDARLQIFKVISPEKDKIETLVNLLCDLGDTSTLVFLNYRGAVERVHKLLKEKDIDSEYFHGGLDQIDRELKLLKFRNGSVRLLITTDLSARGLDIPLVQNVIHYQLPDKEDQYIHRNGRTARMTATGNAYVIQYQEEDLKEYLISSMQEYVTTGMMEIPEPTNSVTLQLSKGKKDKINKVDILGFLTKSCNLSGKDVGLIEVKPYKSYVAVPRSSVDEIIKTTKDRKLKGKSIRAIVI